MDDVGDMNDVSRFVRSAEGQAHLNEIVDALSKEFSVDPGQTTPDGEFTLTTTRCLGCCGLAPVVVFENQVLGKETPETTIDKIKMVLDGGSFGTAIPTAEVQEEAATT